jgi:hypothetical protein
LHCFQIVSAFSQNGIRDRWQIQGRCKLCFCLLVFTGPAGGDDRDQIADTTKQTLHYVAVREFAEQRDDAWHLLLSEVILGDSIHRLVTLGLG